MEGLRATLISAWVWLAVSALIVVWYPLLLLIRLTDREKEMLRILATTPGETVSRLDLAGNGGSVSERAVDVQVNRLRRKIERNPANPLFVQTVRGIGYRLVTA